MHRAAQKRFTRSAGWAVGRTSQSGGVRRTGYNTKRLKLSSYRNKLWDNTRFSTHFRSNLAVSAVFTTTAFPVTCIVGLSPSWGGNVSTGGSTSDFWQPTGGAREIGSNAFRDPGDLTIRGGRWGRRYFNGGNTAVRLERWEIYWKPNQPVIPIPPTQVGFVEQVGWDPTYIPDFQNKFRVGRKFVTTIEPGDTFTIENKIPIQKIDQTIWQNGGQRPWVYETMNNANDEQVPVTVTAWHSVSFTGDLDQDVGN